MKNKTCAVRLEGPRAPDATYELECEFEYPRGARGHGAAPFVIDGALYMVFSWFELEDSDRANDATGTIVRPWGSS